MYSWKTVCRVSFVTILLTKLEFLRWSAGGCEVLEKCWKVGSPVGYQVEYFISQNGVGFYVVFSEW